MKRAGGPCGAPVAAAGQSPARRRFGVAATMTVAAILAGCASSPSVPGRVADGPGSRSAAELAQIADAEPRIEPVRAGGPNKPYQVAGRSYAPLAADADLVERGLASWYGRGFHGRPTASGETYDMYAMTAAHPTLPIPSYARVRNPANGREAIVRINDRGPFHPGRIVDLSYAAAARLDLLRGVAPVELERITWSQIRAGRFRREPREGDPRRAERAGESREAIAARLLGIDPPLAEPPARAKGGASPAGEVGPPPAGER